MCEFGSLMRGNVRQLQLRRPGPVTQLQKGGMAQKGWNTLLLGISRFFAALAVRVSLGG